MGRKVKDTSLDTREARRKLKQRHEPYWRLIDGGLHLGYRKGPRGGVWIARVFRGGHYLKESIASADDILDANGLNVLDFGQAQQKVHEFHARLKTGSGKTGHLTVKQAAEHYLEWFRAHKKSAYSTEATIKAHILPNFGDHEVASLTADELKKWLRKLAEQPARLRTPRDVSKQAHREKPSTDEEKRARRASANRVFTVLRAILNKVFEDGRVNDDKAWRKVKPFESTDAGAIRFLKPDECVRLINACSLDLRALVRGALYTGARFGELARLTVADVHSAEGRVYLSPAAESGRGRYVPLNGEATQFFTDLVAGKAGTESVFPKADGLAWGKNHHVRAFEKANKAAKIQPPIGFHDLRHTYATLFANAGGNTLDMLAQILGHADTRITKKHYAHLFDDTLKAAVAKLPSLGYERVGAIATLRPKRVA